MIKMKRVLMVVCAVICLATVLLRADEELREDDDGNAYIIRRDTKRPAWVPVEPSRPKINWRRPMLDRNFSFGLELARRMEYSYTNPLGESTQWEPGVNDVSWVGGFNMRIFFSNSNWGIGIDGLLLDYAKIDNTLVYASSAYNEYGYYANVFKPDTMTWYIKWLCDFDILFRFPIIPGLLINGGAGLTMEMVTWAQEDMYGSSLESGVEVGDIGFNWKLGLEYFLDKVWSLTLDWKWQQWTSGAGKEAYRIHSLVGGINFSF